MSKKVIKIDGKTVKMGEMVTASLMIDGANIPFTISVTPQLLSLIEKTKKEAEASTNTYTVDDLTRAFIDRMAKKIGCDHDKAEQAIVMVGVMSMPAFIRLLVRECSIILNKQYKTKFNNTEGLYYITADMEICKLTGVPSTGMCTNVGLFHSPEEAQMALHVGKHFFHE